MNRKGTVRAASRELFTVKNSDWTLTETEPGVFELASADGLKNLGGLSSKGLVSASAVISELARHLAQ